jgi:hypothetical protein
MTTRAEILAASLQEATHAFRDSWQSIVHAGTPRQAALRMYGEHGHYAASLGELEAWVGPWVEKQRRKEARRGKAA